MKRSEIRESLVAAPDFAALHPGYMLRDALRPGNGRK
jgi:hypothetical protein